MRRLFCLFALFAISSSAEEKPNILFIFADDWGWGDLSCHDHPYIKTPNIDRLAAEGTDFTNFTVGSGVCSPSRAAAITGKFPAHFGVNGHFADTSSNAKRKMPDWLDPEAPMLPRILQDAGYMTGHFGKWHLTGSEIADAPRPELYGYDKVGAYNCPGELMPVHEDANQTIALIEESKKAGKPFFINLWVHEPHTPFHTVQEYQDRFPDLKKADNIYASVLSHADDRIGQVLDALDRLELTDNTLVIFSSDNGPESNGGQKKLVIKYDPATGEGYDTGACVGTTGGRKGRKRSLFQGGIGVPFLARWPGKIEAGRKDDISWISAVDLLPTFCEVAGVTLPENFEADGTSQLAVLTGDPAPLRTKPLYWKSQSAGKGKGQIGDYAILAGKWKLLTDNQSKKAELYDISADPLEQTDLSNQHPEQVQELVRKLEEWKLTLPSQVEPKLMSKFRNEK
jgi:arylsulfatase A-like enzyme